MFFFLFSPCFASFEAFLDARTSFGVPPPLPPLRILPKLRTSPRLGSSPGVISHLTALPLIRQPFSGVSHAIAWNETASVLVVFDLITMTRLLGSFPASHLRAMTVVQGGRVVIADGEANAIMVSIALSTFFSEPCVVFTPVNHFSAASITSLVAYQRDITVVVLAGFANGTVSRVFPSRAGAAAVLKLGQPVTQLMRQGSLIVGSVGTDVVLLTGKKTISCESQSRVITFDLDRSSLGVLYTGHQDGSLRGWVFDPMTGTCEQSVQFDLFNGETVRGVCHVSSLHVIAMTNSHVFSLDTSLLKQGEWNLSSVQGTVVEENEEMEMLCNHIRQVVIAGKRGDLVSFEAILPVTRHSGGWVADVLSSPIMAVLATGAACALGYLLWVQSQEQKARRKKRVGRR